MDLVLQSIAKMDWKERKNNKKKKQKKKIKLNPMNRETKWNEKIKLQLLLFGLKAFGSHTSACTRKVFSKKIFSPAIFFFFGFALFGFVDNKRGLSEANN